MGEIKKVKIETVISLIKEGFVRELKIGRKQLILIIIDSHIILFF